MKVIIFLALAFVLACVVQAQPVADKSQKEVLEVHTLEEDLPENADVQEHSRQKRATCDLLSKWNWNHTACAAHCLARKYKGGYCNDKAVCVCRH
ncbi:defensin [Drosophila bipectinata]|uniref:defensin n=1 Tax=Drosophila bipectinata TaxID=42026 RepID=UPI001C89E7F4|nr:defensin [Drosophila bipectinata]